MKLYPSPEFKVLARWLMVAALPLWLSGCGEPAPDAPVHHHKFLAFGTLMEIDLVGVGSEQALQVTETLEDDFRYMHEAWHAWDPGPLGRTNELLASGERFSAPPSVLPLLELSSQLAIESDHLFNPAVGKLIERWGYLGKEVTCEQIPSQEDIAPLVEARPRMTDIEVDGFHLRSGNPAVKLDFGGVGKGYGIDLAFERLAEIGIKNALINAGGDLRATGDRGGRPWRVAVKSPSGDGVVLGFVEIQGNDSAFTSGNYERNLRCGDKLYHHIIDPRTGFPARGALSVTVMHPQAAKADAAATALFVAGVDGWLEIARKMQVEDVLLVDEQGVIHMTPTMQARFKLLETDREVRVSEPVFPPQPD